MSDIFHTKDGQTIDTIALGAAGDNAVDVSHEADLTTLHVTNPRGRINIIVDGELVWDALYYVENGQPAFTHK